MKLDPQYDPKTSEKELYQKWLDLRLFEASADSQKPKFCLILPPPNVTGVLHMGHALTATIEDLIVRRKRMQGYNTLWVPGTDHAGIATQMVVERNLLKEENTTKHQLGRDKFLEKVWEWKERSQGTILNQLKLIGCSVDWTRLAFTLDENVSVAVRECFVRLYRDGLIYRENAIIQWCPRCHTALSDLEVKFKEMPGKFWHIRYRLKKDPNRFVVVATTRPETLLADTAVAVHPEDERFQDLHGETLLLPLLNREIPLITDEYVDRTFGTGALKITPGHDPNDYMVGKKHGLPILNLLDESAKLNEVGGPYQGLSREKGRTKVVEDLQAQGLLVKEEDHRHNVGHCDRCSTVVEPRVSAQWFVKADILAQDAIRVVEKKEIRIIPEEWEKTYFEWMRNIRPWCISRQLWWGHRIPVWYCQDCPHMTVSVQTPAKCEKCASQKIRQEEDVLDTWFSSGLWPFSTLGWPKDTADLKTFYPTDVMETGFDILFFWVARMIMLGLRMTGKIPFHTVYLHPMVRDEHGQKMSKTKGNVVDPLEICERMGTDALRFFLASNAYHGRDLRVSDEGVEGCRNFVNKIWNAARFVLMHFEDVTEPKIDTRSEINQWVLSRLNHTKKSVQEALDQYRFFDAAQTLYHFVWHEYCFWFIEFIKSKDELETRKASKDATAVYVLEEILRLLHPFMPFVTEKIWLELPLRDKGISSIVVAPYPEPDSKMNYVQAEQRIERVTRIIDSIRQTRGIHNVSPAKDIALVITPLADEAVLTDLTPFAELIKKLAKASELVVTKAEPGNDTHIASILKDLKIFIRKSDLGDLEKEMVRKQKELQEKMAALTRADEKLRNERFMQSAPDKVKEGVVKQREELAREVKALEQYLKDIGGSA